MRPFVLPAASLLLVLLASTSIAKAPPPAELARDHGLVVVEWRDGGGELMLEPVAGGRDIALQPIADAPGRWSAWVPAGEYRIAKRSRTAWDSGLPTISVEAGRATDLGLALPIGVGGYQDVVLFFPSASEPALAARIAAVDAAALGPQPALAWSASMPSKPFAARSPGSGLGLVADLLLAHDRKVNRPSPMTELLKAETRDDFLRLARTMAAPRDSDPAVGDDGRVWFPAALGRVRIRGTDGTWAAAGPDTLAAVTAVEVAGDRIVVGTDDGELHESRDDGATWTRVHAFGAGHAVADIDHDDAHWVVATHAHAADGVATGLHVYAAGADLGGLREVGAFPYQLAPYVLFDRDGQLVGGRYVVFTPPESVRRLDLASGQWTDITPPKVAAYLHANADGSVLTALRPLGAMTKIYRSTDLGDSWTQLARPPYQVHDAQLDTADSGVAIRAHGGAFKVIYELYDYDGAADAWRLVGEAPFGCVPVRVAPALPLLCVTTSGSVLRQEGAEWIVEFSTGGEG